ncbi:MAG: heat-inducible transcriptional repressor HrcA, partial [Actinobacteria bacterium]|nr:heat-inducible transcriptional repressor HrcA [Actinomycetota bacterium]
TPARLMIVLITDAGGIEQRVVELTQDVSENFLHTLRTQFNSAMMGHRLPEVADRISGILESYSLRERKDVAIVMSSVIEMAMDRHEEKIVLAGTANLARFQEDFSTTMHPVLEALEEQVVLLKLLGDASQSVKVRIGNEQSDKNLRTTSLIAVGYGSEDVPLGALGVIGPTRMDYAGSMAAVSAVARYVGRFINEGV